MSIPILLPTYLIAEILAPFFAAFVIVNAVLLFGQIVPLLDLLLNLGIRLTDFIRLLAYLWPKLLVFSVPMTGMIAIILAFSRLTNEGEIMAMKCCGLGVRRFFFPVIFVAFLLATLSAYAGITLSPTGGLNTNKLLFHLAKDKFAHGLKEKYFSEGTGDFVIYVEHIDPDTASLEGVFLSDARDRMSPFTILARNGNFSADSENLSIQLQLREGSMHKATDQTVQTIYFDKYQLSIPLTLPGVVGGKDIQAVGKRGGMSLTQLQEKAALAGYSSPEGISMLVEYHKRLASPVGCFLLCLLGLPLGLLAGPGKRAIGLPAGILFFLAYFSLLTACEGLSEKALLPVWVTMWAPNGLYALLCGVLFYLAAKEKLSLLSGWLENTLFNISRRLPWSHKTEKVTA